MKPSERPLPLKNAPLRYAPENELGVVFLFSRVAKRLQFRIEKIRAAYPIASPTGTPETAKSA
jgi:hypothetical protein